MRIATDTGSGKSMDRKKRPGLAQALDDLDAGTADVLLAAKLDRLSRSAADFGQIMARSEAKKWRVIVLDVAVDTSTPAGELLVGVMAQFAQFERRIIGQRTKDALAAKRAAGVVLGRRRNLDPAVRARVCALRESGQSFAAIARQLNEEGVATAQGGAQWHASTVRGAVLLDARDRAEGTTDEEEVA